MKKLVILGGGESGVGAAVLAKQKGYDVFLSDNGIINKKYKSVLSNNDVDFEERKHSVNRILKADEVIKSPGIAGDVDVVRKCRAKGLPVISEIEFAYRHSPDSKKICITGSNGKTTTTFLTYHILKNGGLNVGLAGNIGKSFALQVAENDFDFYVIEISSFQLDDIHSFKADIAVLMNITPDHLDRYDNNFSKYIDSKFRIIQNQCGQDAFIYCLDDKVIRSELRKRNIKSRIYPFSIKKRLIDKGAFLNENNQVLIKTDKTMLTIETLALQGKHNIYNSMAAALAARILDIRKDKVKDSLSDFKNLEHRLENVINLNGIEYINDSKATNVNSTWWALESMTKPVVWIAGGQDKGNNYAMLQEIVKRKVKAIICLGVDNKKLVKAFAPLVEMIVEVKSMRDAVKNANRLANPGDVVLLSPACASYDLFDDYEDRGRQFKRIVKEY